MNIPFNQNSNSNDANYDQTSAFYNALHSKDGNEVDINNFISECQVNNSMHKISSSNDLAIIAECSEPHSNFKGILNKRFNNLKMLLGFCEQKNLLSALNAINIMKDQTVINDFLHFFINKNRIVKTAMTLDHVVLLLPHLKSQINSKYDCYQVISIKSAKIILESIRERIASIKESPECPGIDIARDERINKCNEIIGFYDQLKECPSLEKIKVGSNEELRKLVKEFALEVQSFLKSW